MSARSWRWLLTRIIGLLEQPALWVPYQSGEVTKFLLVPSTRVGLALNPPKPE